MATKKSEQKGRSFSLKKVKKIIIIEYTKYPSKYHNF